MTTGVEQGIGPIARTPRWGLKPVANKAGWVLGGLLLQCVGVGVPLAHVISQAKKQSVAGLLNVASVKLAWHGSLHTKSGVGLLIGGAVVFAIGCVLLARPFVKSRLTLLIAVPLAALAGVLVLGAVAVIIALAWAGLDATSGGGGGSSGGGLSSGKPKEKSEPSA